MEAEVTFYLLTLYVKYSLDSNMPFLGPCHFENISSVCPADYRTTGIGG